MISSEQHGPADGETIRVITGPAMSNGPHAVARHEGKVLFVRGAAPDEEIDVVVREERRKFAYADVTAVHRASASRREPPCPYLPRCGGCPWQHLEYAAQLQEKRKIVEEQLRRIGGLAVEVPPVIPSPLEFRYRQRLKLRAAGGRVGFFAGGTHDLVPVDDCLLADPRIGRRVPVLHGLAEAAGPQLGRVEIAATGASGDEIVVAAEVQGRLSPDRERRCRDWLASSGLAGLTLTGRRWRRVRGKDSITIEPEDGLRLETRIGTFSQVNPAANRLLVARVLEFLAPQPDQEILDLYAGSGNFAVPIGRRGVDVHAVEQDPRAVSDGNRNARGIGLERFRFENTAARRALAALVEAGRRFDAVVLDPPRSGARESLDGLLALAPRRLVYASCDPATLARDLARISRAYRVERIQPIDLFPHTYHVETVVEARLI